MRIVVVGSGYVGLVSGACLADFGHQVTCVDTDEVKVRKLARGQIPIFEPGLDVLVAGNVAVGRLSFTTSLADALVGADVAFIAVGTPSRRGDGYADLSYVYAAAEEIARCATGELVVVTKSTVPVGTGDEVERLVRMTRPDLGIDVASNPEFLREGSAIEDFKRPDRLVIGTASERAREVMRLLYRPLFLNETPILFTSRRTAELTKYAANAFLATKISFINEIADICERSGADVQEVARGMGLDRRIGSKFLHPGPGYGGSCFPKDTLALVRTAEQFGAPSSLVSTVVEANERRKERMAHRVVEAFGGSVAGKIIGILGVTFKPRTDDMRDAPSIEIVARLSELGARIVAYDPAGMHEARKLEAFATVQWRDSPYDVMPGADALVIVTEWDEFRALNLQKVRALLGNPLIIDMRNVYTLEEMKKAGFAYVSIGRPSVAGDDRHGTVALPGLAQTSVR